MRADRRRVVCAVGSVFVLGGCLSDPSLAMPFDLRIENRDTRPRELSVAVERGSMGIVYEGTHRLDPGERVVEPAVAETAGRYRISVTDRTTDDERTAERHVELTTGEAFCGWFAVRAEAESVTATVPRCPNETNETTTPDL